MKIENIPIENPETRRITRLSVTSALHKLNSPSRVVT